MTAPLPSDVDGHFGTSLRCHVLYQYFQNHVTQPLIYEELCELGIDISIGQVNRLVTEGHDAFHEEKDDLLSAGLAVSSYIHTDDTLVRSGPIFGTESASSMKSLHYPTLFMRLPRQHSERI